MEISEIERKAIGQCKLLLAGDITLHILDDDGGTAYAGVVNKGYNKDLETVLNLIETQNKMIELMAEYIIDLIKYNNPKEERNKQEIIEYFRNKSKESE